VLGICPSSLFLNPLPLYDSHHFPKGRPVFFLQGKRIWPLSSRAPDATHHSARSVLRRTPVLRPPFVGLGTRPTLLAEEGHGTHTSETCATVSAPLIPAEDGFPCDSRKAGSTVGRIRLMCGVFSNALALLFP
jgi:hypothetical protein